MSCPLEEALRDQIAREAGVTTGLAARRLSAGEQVLINPDVVFHPASTVKLCIMMEVFHQREHGILSLADRIQVLNVFPSLAGSSLYSLDPADDSEKQLYERIGTYCSVAELVELMITVSSNLATNLLLARVSPRATTAFMAQLGASALKIVRGMEDKAAYRLGLNNSATARGFLTILTKLAAGDVISRRASDEMNAILSRQTLNEMIPAGLPTGTPVAHKTGWIDGHFHDVGIIEPGGPDPIVLSVLTRGFDEAASARAHAFIAGLARTVHAAWS